MFIEQPEIFSGLSEDFIKVVMKLAVKESHEKGEFISAQDGQDLLDMISRSEFVFNEVDDLGTYYLDDSFNKVWTLVSQNKLDSTAASRIATDIAAARDCAEDLITTP